MNTNDIARATLVEALNAMVEIYAGKLAKTKLPTERRALYAEYRRLHDHSHFVQHGGEE